MDYKMLFVEQQGNQEGKKINQEEQNVFSPKDMDYIPTKDSPLFVKGEQCKKCEAWGYYSWIEKREDETKDFIKECIRCKDKIVLEDVQVSFMDL